MTMISRLSRYIPGLIALLLVSQQSLAGGSVGTITYESTAASVPLLGGAGLVILSALLGVVSLRFLKERGRASFLVIAVMTTAVVSAGGGIKLVSDAQAISRGIQLTEFSGGEVTIPSAGFNSVFNAAGSTQEISAITLNKGCALQELLMLQTNGGNGGNGGSFRGPCSDKPGTVLQPGDFCDISVCCDGPNGGNGGNGGCF